MPGTQTVVDPKSDTLRREWAKIVAKAWADPEFRKRLEKNPKAVLKERGVELDEGVDLAVVDRPVELEEIERSVQPMEMAVAAGFGSPATLGAPYNAGAIHTLPYPPPTVEGKGGVCVSTPACGGLCITWGAAQPYDFTTGAVFDPTTEGKVKLCAHVNVTAGLCVSFGAAQPPGATAAVPPQPQHLVPQPQLQPLYPQPPQQTYGPPPPAAQPTQGYGILPTTEGGVKFGLCAHTKLCGGLCISVGAADPYQTMYGAVAAQPQQFVPQPPQPQPPQTYPQPPQQTYGPPPPQQPYGPPTQGYDPTAEGKFGLCLHTKLCGGLCVSVGAAQPATAAVSAGWALTVSQPACWGSPQQSSGPQTRPAVPGSA